MGTEVEPPREAVESLAVDAVPPYLLANRSEPMSLNIDNAEADRLAKELAELTGEPLDQAVTKALRDRLEKQREIERVRRAVKAISDHVATLPVLDSRSPDEIIGYNENGVPA
jgi:antitoxin VapB